MIEKSLEYFKNRLSKTLSDKRREAYQDAVRALEKQMSKKVDMRTEYRDLNNELVCFKGFCPSCGWTVESYRNKSCNRCGQRLDWSE